MCFSTAKYARLHVQVMSTKWKTILKSSLKSIFQGEVIVGNHFNLGFQCYSDVTKKKLNDLGPQCVEFCHNFIIKKTHLVTVGQYLCEGREDTGGTSQLEDKTVADASAGE